jgi:hypothetical protein
VDGISSAVLKNAASSLAYPLSVIFQSSLVSHVVPEGWKQANVVPLFKKGSKAKAGNYRPVSLTSQVCKVFESLLRDAINEHLEKFSLISASQHGFSKGKSCLTNILVFLEDLTRLVDERQCVDIAYLDFAKAFDKVPHGRLVDKLKALGIDGDVALWIQEWLSNRTQRVVLGGQASEWSAVASGVPQGSVLGPILFLVFINDLEDGMLSKVLKFADDTKIYSNVSCANGQAQLQSDLDRATDWSSKWLMSFNVDKCKMVHAGYNNPQASYSMNGIQLQPVDEERDLGITMHKSLSVSRQCAEAAKKGNRAVGQIKRTISNKSKDIVVPLYKSLVRPHLEYCVQAWSPYFKKDIAVLEKVQRRATRLIPELCDLRYEERLQACGITSLEDRRVRGDLIETFKLIKGLEKIPASRFFSEPPSSLGVRGHSCKLFKNRARLETRRHFFSNRVVDNWNKLPQSAVDATSINAFKNHLDKLGV